MATAAELKRMANRTTPSVSLPVPEFIIPKLPEKLARIDPAGAEQFHQDLTMAVNDWVKKLNTVNSDLGAAINSKT